MEEGRIPLLASRGVDDSIMTDMETLKRLYETNTVMCRDDSTVEVKRELCSEDEESVLEGHLQHQDCEDKKILALKSDGEMSGDERMVPSTFHKGEGFHMGIKNEDIKVEIDQTAEIINKESSLDMTASRVLLTLNDNPDVVVDSFDLRSSSNMGASKPGGNEVNFSKDSQILPSSLASSGHKHMPCLIGLLTASNKHDRIYVPPDRVNEPHALNDDSGLVPDSLGLTSIAKLEDSKWSGCKTKKDKKFTSQSVNDACYRGGSAVSHTGEEPAVTTDFSRHLTDPCPSPTVLVDTPKVSMSGGCHRGGRTATGDTSRHLPPSTVLTDTAEKSVPEACNRGEQLATPDISRQLADPGPSATVVVNTSKQIPEGENFSQQGNIVGNQLDQDHSDAGDVYQDSRIKEYICKVCAKGFFSYSNLQAHAAKTHDDKPHSCKFCPKRFSRIADHRHHETTHTGRKPVCKICDKKCLSVSGLKRHQVIHNIANKPYKCGFCTKEFRTFSSLEFHLKSHADQEPFSASSVSNSAQQCLMARRTR